MNGRPGNEVEEKSGASEKGPSPSFNTLANYPKLAVDCCQMGGISDCTCPVVYSDIAVLKKTELVTGDGQSFHGKKGKESTNQHLPN